MKISKFFSNNIFCHWDLSVFCLKSKTCNLLFLKGYFGVFFLIFDFKINILSKGRDFCLAVTEKKKKNVTGLYYIFLTVMLYDVSFGWGAELRLFGVGYSVIYDANKLVFNVGTTASLFFVLPATILFSIQGKKNNAISFFGISRIFVKTFIYRLILLRKPNIYTGKGIFYKHKLFAIKQGKIKKAI